MATTIVTGVLYTATMLVMKPLFPVIKEAATPARVAFDAVEVDKSLIDGYYA